MSKARKSFLLRLDPTVYEALERWAQQELRSVNGQIEYALKQALARHFGPGGCGKAAARKNDDPNRPRVE